MKKTLLLVPLFILGGYSYSAPAKMKANLSTIKLVKETKNEYAKKLARIGEILLTDPKNIQLADEMFDRALDVDPTLGKALFYSSLTKIVMSFKGSFQHAKGHVSDTELENFKKDVLETKYPELIDFALNLLANIDKMEKKSDLFKFMKETLLPAVKDSILKAQSITKTFDIIIPYSGKKVTRTQAKCYSYSGETHCYDYTETTTEGSYNGRIVKISPADAKVIRGVYVSLANRLRIATAYNLEKAETVARSIEVKQNDLQRKLTAKETIKIVRKYPSFLTLHADNELAEIHTSLEETLRSALDLADMRDVLCNLNSRVDYIFQNLCVSSEIEDGVNTAMKYLSGPTMHKIGETSLGKDVNIKLNITSLFQNPFKDLKLLLPTKFNANGRGQVDLEGTFNGIFPDADLAEKIEEINN